MKKIIITLLISTYFIPFNALACSVAPPIDEYIQEQNEFPTIFIGKILERKIEKDDLGSPKTIQLKFLPLKVKKGTVQLNNIFWYPVYDSNPGLRFIVGDAAYIYADQNNQIAFGGGCYTFSGSLGQMSIKQIDAMMINWKLEEALTSNSRTELQWAKNHLQKEINNLKGDEEKKYWQNMLKIIKSRLEKVY